MPASFPLAARVAAPFAALALGLLCCAAWPQDAQAELGQHVLQAINAYRDRQGLDRLQPDVALAMLAAGHSREMALQRQFSHAGFDRRAELAGGARCVENLALGYHEAGALLAAWQASPAHDANLLEPGVRRVGIAQVDGYLTLLACTAPAPLATLARSR